MKINTSTRKRRRKGKEGTEEEWATSQRENDEGTDKKMMTTEHVSGRPPKRPLTFYCFIITSFVVFLVLK